MILGRRIAICLGAVAVGAGAALLLSHTLAHWFVLRAPGHVRHPDVLPTLEPLTRPLSFVNAVELGVALALPVFVSQILIEHERRRALVAIAALLDVAGILGAYFAIIRTVLAHRFGADPQVTYVPRLSTLVGICCDVVLIAAVASQLPLVIAASRGHMRNRTRAAISRESAPATR